MLNIPTSLHKFLAEQPPATALPAISVLGIQGPDALAFAQSQFMNDIDQLAVMQWQWSGWLNTRGRVIALFLVLRVAPDALLLLSPDMPASELGKRLIGYVLRNQLQMGVWSELYVSGSFELSDLADHEIGGSWESHDLSVSMPVQGIARTLHVSDKPTPLLPQAVDAWNMLSLLAGIPSLNTLQVEKWTPQQLSLQRLQAFSVKKGCYPGQEIVARTHFLGKNKRELVLLTGDGVDHADPGTLVSVATFAGDRVALSVLNQPAQDSR